MVRDFPRFITIMARDALIYHHSYDDRFVRDLAIIARDLFIYVSQSWWEICRFITTTAIDSCKHVIPVTCKGNRVSEQMGRYS